MAQSSEKSIEIGVGNSVAHSPLSVLERVIKVLYLFFSWLGTIIMILIMVMTVADVFGRKALNTPVPGTVELIQFMLVFFAFASIFMTTTRGANIVVDIFSSRFPRPIQHGLMAISLFIGTIAMFVVSWQLWLGAMDWLHKGPTSPVTAIYKIPFYPFKFVASVEAGLVAFCLLVCFFRSLGHRPRKGAIDFPEATAQN